jgi:hypothetical protein
LRGSSESLSLSVMQIIIINMTKNESCEKPALLKKLMLFGTEYSSLVLFLSSLSGINVVQVGRYLKKINNV